MEAYTGFAQVYDKFMDNIDYKAWCSYLISILNEYNIGSGILLEMGCGTGNVTRILADKGFDMIGIDNSQEMLDMAMQKLSNKEILYLLQDMREFELYGTVSAVVSICDSINYITDYKDLVKVFKLVNNYLDPKGIFIFDLRTPHSYEQIGDSVIAEDREDCSFIWDNYYDKNDMINEYQLSLFVKEQGNRYRKFTETHYQRAYNLDEIKSALSMAGMEFVQAKEAFTNNSAKDNNERIYIIARESGK